MTDLFNTFEARSLFLEQLREVRRGRDLVLHVCDRTTEVDQARLWKQIAVLDEVIEELREVWAERDAVDQAKLGSTRLDELRAIQEESPLVEPLGDAAGMRMLVEQSRN
jgi:hypothetical protein